MCMFLVSILNLRLSTIFQLYHGCLFFVRGNEKKTTPDITTILPQVADNFHHKAISSTPYYEEQSNSHNFSGDRH
jgi:hypothetical protein